MTTSSETRIEQDSMGELAVPAEALYAAQTQRAVDNFPVSGQPMPAPFIRALLLAKRAAATANSELEQIPSELAEAICGAVDELLATDFMPHFPVDVFQTGSGTSSNMNANEVLMSLAARRNGQPVSAHWGMPDPVKAEGTDAEKSLAFQQAYGTLRNRMLGFTSLPLTSLDRISLQKALDDAGQTDKEGFSA